ncbi:MAG: PD-(D/E)XK nuclease family protein, partial [Candidatus Gracilibacteria bacterium]|nr:PD-(D/E)XK nuclease family protein [Candidatus Gracilibacteria bacterium]
IQDIFTLFNKIKDFCILDKNFSLEKFLSKIQLYQKYNILIPRQIIKKQKSGINILTAHSSKGLEYEIVFVPGLYNGNWENKRVIDKLKLPLGIAGGGLQQEFESIEEDRRLLFVACSRAKKELILSTPLSIDKKIKIISSFIGEVDGYFTNEESLEISDNLLQKSIISELKIKLYKFENSEFDYIKEFFENYKLSPTDLNIFLDDPLKFLNQVVFKYPFLDNDALVFGKVYHRVLELFYSKFKQNNKYEDIGYLEFTFKALLKKEILSPDSYDKLLERGLKSVRGLYEIIKNNQRKILATEYNFRPKNLLFENIPITGKIDKIEIESFIGNNLSNEGQLVFFKEKVSLVDYKTGSPKSIGEIKGIGRDGTKKETGGNYFRQLMFYKLLCDLDLDFSSKYDIGGLVLDFIEGKDGEYKYVEVPYTEEEFEYFKNELISSWEKISNIEYWKEILS